MCVNSRSPRETSQARLERIRLEQLKEKMELKRQKDLMKQMETPEQKRLRRLAKKEAKERKKKEEMGWDEEYMVSLPCLDLCRMLTISDQGYTNTDNPFGDANLLKPFAWSKKMEKEGLVSLTEEAIEKRNKKILEANKFEDAELQALLDEDSTQMQEKLAKQLQVSHGAVSQRLNSLGMTQKLSRWQSYAQKSWGLPGQFPKQTLRPNRFGKKAMLCIWWDQTGVVYFELLKPGKMVNTSRYEQQMHSLREALNEKRPEWREKHNKLILQHDNAPAHNATRELEKVKRRRLERERERESRDEELNASAFVIKTGSTTQWQADLAPKEMAASDLRNRRHVQLLLTWSTNAAHPTRIQREKEAAQFKEWEKQEDIFHLQQAILRSKIRIEDGRAKAIDLLARYISAEEGDLTVEMNEPYIYLNGLSISDLEDLQEDIRVYKELENGRNQDYWKDLEIIAEDELHKLRKKDDQVGRRDGINPAVAGDVVGIFRGRGPEELEALHSHIEAKIRAEDEGVDIGYWETLLSRLRAFMARARLRQRHQDNLHRKLLQLKKEQGVETGPLFPCAKTIDPKPSTSTQPPQAVKEDLPPPPPPAPSKEPTPPAQPQPQDPPSPQPGPSTAPPDEEEMETSVTQEEAEYETGGYSPRLIPLSSLEPGTLLTDPEEDWKRLLFQRSQLLGTGKVENELTKEEQAFEREARKGMVDDEASFSVESPLDKTYLWSDKYRPRKPRYFNRVHTGFEWNKYNQTHYDLDNPPPKIVQGYKFNIFYPDLIDKSITPQFFLEPCADNKDFAILRFHAGPPYEDIAFKIVNREWEYSYKRGYRCQFYNNIFQLWFHFKRYRYRR
ncbi:CACTIN [Cordylochernes scorpioides]|uniref:Splicing factor Cactin n=1 Tax=Cordylochernes scorpioides TaxID=51811 RepID=A0ABY6KX86_9ARAC|nr:CACTIN [Cordylochernes scorpioides]